MMDAKEICLRLLSADSEAAAHDILGSVPEMLNAANWRPLDGRETNFNVTSNQAATGGKALTELMTNMVDAVLMRHALAKGVDPKGPDAPRTMYEAVDRLVHNLRGGRIVDAHEAWLKDFAQRNLVIGVTGAKTKKEGLPCYTFVDNGEGQSPDTFERTFLSLSAGNKKDVPFVQGQYNMGSSGVLGYCGRRWFKLILSRRFDGKSPWGWTLMRRRPGGGMPVAEYFVTPDGRIPRFDADTLFPFTTALGKRYDKVSLRTGTIVKLYDYQVGTQFLTFRGARETLNENLVETILPFRLLDLRQMPKTAEAREKAIKRGGDRAEGIDARPFYGMEYLLLRSHREEVGDDDEDEAAGVAKLAVATIDDPELGEVTVSAIPLKRRLPEWLRKSNARVFHTVNGQVQYKQTRGYLSQTCGLPALKDRVVIVVDASRLSFGAHNDVWKGDREHVRSTTVGERYLDKVAAAIRESQVLKELQAKVSREELEIAARVERNDLFQRLVASDRTLAGLLVSRDPSIHVPSGGAGRGQTEEDEYEGSYSPTFLRFDDRVKAQGIDVPLNRGRSVTARTDAANGYLQRPDNRGHVIIDDEFRSRFSTRQHLHDGRLTVFLEAVEGAVSPGETFDLKLALADDAMPSPVEDLVTIRVLDEETAPKPARAAGAKDAQGDKPLAGRADGQAASMGGPPGSGAGGQGAPTHGLPRYTLLTRDGREIAGQPTERWPDGFSEQDGGYAEDLGDEVIYKINYDNAYHLTYRMQQRGAVAKDVVSEKYILGMRILMLGCEHALRMASKGEGFSEFADDFRRMVARGAASTVLTLAENLPKIVDSSAVQSADVE